MCLFFVSCEDRDDDWHSAQCTKRNIKMLFSVSCPCAVPQRVPLKTPSTAHCLQPGGTSWPRSDRGSWPMRFTTSGKRGKTSLLSDTSTPASGKAVRNTAMVRQQSAQASSHKLNHLFSPGHSIGSSLMVHFSFSSSTQRIMILFCSYL